MIQDLRKSKEDFSPGVADSVVKARSASVCHDHMIGNFFFHFF